jgi:hypothetical protein
VPQFDPFLLLDDFHSADLSTFRLSWHPHRGIETITYVLQGDVEHGDSMGNRGDISPGDVQWMTAGSGIIHQEMPKGDGEGRMWGFQLWANLPATHKMMDPRYRDVTSGQIPEVALGNGITAKIVCGRVDGSPGTGEDIVTDPEYLDVTVPAGTIFTRPVKRKHTVFAYVVDGQAFFDPERDAFAREAAGGTGTTWSKCLCGRRPRLLRRRGRRNRHHGRPAGPIPSCVGKTDRRAGRMVRTHRHEHPGGASDRLQGVLGRDLHQAPLNRRQSTGGTEPTMRESQGKSAKAAGVLFVGFVGWSLYGAIVPVETYLFRMVHMAFVFGLAFLVYPVRPNAGRWTIWLDLLMAILGVASIGYACLDTDSRPPYHASEPADLFRHRSDPPAEISRRIVSNAFTLVVTGFLIYIFRKYFRTSFPQGDLDRIVGHM